MKITAMTLTLGALALAVASAASAHHFTLYQKAMLGGTELQPGDYKVEVQGDKAVIKNGKNVVAVNASVATADKKFSQTEIRLDNGANGPARIQEIDLGGTTDRIVVSTPQPGGGGGQ